MTETEICIRALRIVSVADRAEYLDGVCAGDIQLRRRVDDQLAEFDVTGGRPQSFRPHASVGQSVDGLLKRQSEAGTTSGPFLQSTDAAGDRFREQQPAPESLEYFRTQRVLGEGGMGTVYLADDTRLGRLVALKTLKRELAASPAAKDRFLREARSAASLEHDHIIPIYYVGEADGVPFLAMPFLQGESLESRIRRERVEKNGGPAIQCASAKPLWIREAIRIARQIALGLAAAHSHGLIHRDIKPANIWLEAPTGRVKILDFGLVRSLKENKNLTSSGAILGTPAYMAPEQARGRAIDARADLFGLGCVLYEMVAGNRAFTGSDTIAILTSVALDQPPAPHEVNPECPKAVSELTMTLLAKRPDERPASAEVVAEILARLETLTSEQLLHYPAEASPQRQMCDKAPSLSDAMGVERSGTPRAKRRRLGFLIIALSVASLGLGLLLGGELYRIIANKGDLSTVRLTSHKIN